MFEPIVVCVFVDIDVFMSTCQDISYVDINVDKRHVDNSHVVPGPLC